MNRLLAALTALVVSLVLLIPAVLQAEGGTDRDILWTVGHYIYPPGGEKKLKCDHTGSEKCKITTYKQYALLPEDIEGYTGQDDDYYYFDAILNANGEMVNSIGGDETIAIPKALWPEE